MSSGAGGGSLVEVRLLDGPNLYFPRPAAKLTLHLGSLLSMSTERAQEMAGLIGLSGARPGPPDSFLRQRFAARLVSQIVRQLARAAGVDRLAVRTRSGSALAELVVAYPWRNSGRAESLARGLALVLETLDADPGAVLEVIQTSGAALAAAPLGDGPRLIRPKIPVVAVTGTNGKTTTSRMLGHIALQAGLQVGWSSTDGVYINGALVESGDYSGPSGAGQVLRYPGIQLAITETARGGILRRGVGVAYNDVSVVTNISTDHLGVDGIDTLDQLAEVKAVITKITKPTGWCVLNADDPRAFAMRLGTKAQIWAFTRDADSPSGRAVLNDGGRVTTILDGWVCVLAAGADPLPVVPVADVPMTLAGLSRVNVENTLAVASAALALDFSVEQIAAGLTSFSPAEDNPGRMNVWTLELESGGGISVVIDLAHNEAGLEGLLEIMRGIRAPGGRLLLGVGTAGDRTDDVFVRLGEIAALGADVVEIAHKDSYLRGRPMVELGALIRQGAANAGVDITDEHEAELPTLVSLVSKARDGDVVALMTHQDRTQADGWLEVHAGSRDSNATLRAKVLRAQSTEAPQA